MTITFNLMPKDTQLIVFSYLSPENLRRCSRVCRIWRTLANTESLWMNFTPSVAFGKKEWEKYLGVVGQQPCLPHMIDKILNSPCPFVEGKRVEETHLLTLIPETVNGKPLTLNFLEELVKQPKQGQPTKYRYDCISHLIRHGTNPVSRSYWVLMTREIIPKSTDEVCESQVRLLNIFTQKAKIPYETPYEMPLPIEAATSILTEYLRTGKRLYGGFFRSLKYTRCQAFLPFAGTVDIGGLNEDGLRVDDVNGSHGSDVGVAGVRKFIAPEATLDNKEINKANTQREIALDSPVAAEVKTYIASHATTVTPALIPSFTKPLCHSNILGKIMWNQYLGNVGEEPPLPADIYKILKSPCPFIEGKRVEETHLLTLIPRTVDGVLFTLNNLQRLVKHPKKGTPAGHWSYCDDVRYEYGSEPLQRSRWVLITKDVIPGSRNKSYGHQDHLLNEHSKKAKVTYNVPLLLEATTIILMEYLRSNKWLYGDRTDIRCMEKTSKFAKHPSQPIIVSPYYIESGIQISGSEEGNEFGYDHIALAGVRRFCVDESSKQTTVEQLMQALEVEEREKLAAPSYPRLEAKKLHFPSSIDINQAP